MYAIRLLTLCGFLGGVALQAEAPAGMPFSSLCQTPKGVCEATPAPVGATCMCGRDVGRTIFPPQNVSNACGTQQGVCRVEYGPLGSWCTCGRGPGQRIQFR